MSNEKSHKFYVYKIIKRVSFNIEHEARIKICDYIAHKNYPLCSDVLQDLYETTLYRGYKLVSRSCSTIKADPDYVRDYATLKCESKYKFEEDSLIKVIFEVWPKEL